MLSKKPKNQTFLLSDGEFLLMVHAAFDLVYEAGKWEGQVELEEHYDREQYSTAIIEVLHSCKNATPINDASTGNTVTVNLRSQKWRDGVRKSTNVYLEKAMLLVRSYYRHI